MDLKHSLEIDDYDPSQDDQAIKAVIARANINVGAISLLSLLVGWVWVIFAGFGQKIIESQHNEREEK